jgi:hypothetical protein
MLRGHSGTPAQASNLSRRPLLSSVGQPPCYERANVASLVFVVAASKRQIPFVKPPYGSGSFQHRCRRRELWRQRR